MTRARGQPSRRAVDLAFPHQVVVLDREVRGSIFDQVIAFHAEIGQKMMMMRSEFRNDESHTIYCFADQRHADQFKERFGGERREAKRA